ncbi:S-methyl thiohydantoin desulfurase domain-containing protein [Lysinibacillus sphaericus]|uniref:S-methyl thiohydantoin desulfurase domain-containing protein n=1 Tax=Lysinibacillus sphaericus TaxID=1421 RepID=UPI000C17C56E|nr:DUF917 family protein [Lysinibacillus sphaericus]PIJ97143.1 hypothetical protein CTN02_15290 [Lysinibacillus sphaericus]
MTKVLTYEDGIAAVYGGAILGGGGGGLLEEGLKLVKEIFAAGEPQIIDITELDDEDLVACVAMVGAPSAAEQYISNEQLCWSYRQMNAHTNHRLKGIITNENGAITTINGWLQSVLLHVPVVDAPCNGRAHPTGIMGSLNLHEQQDYQSVQFYAGGKDDFAVQGFVEGHLQNTAKTARQASILAGGLVGVTRNPVNIEYLQKHGAPNAITMAIELGYHFLRGQTFDEKMSNILQLLNGEHIVSGEVKNYVLTKENGFDVGKLSVGDYHLTFWNEYMTLSKEGQLQSKFPDLMMTFDTEKMLPVPSASIKEGMQVAVIHVDQSHLKLSSTMENQELLKEIDEVIKGVM